MKCVRRVRTISRSIPTHQKHSLQGRMKFFRLPMRVISHQGEPAGAVSISLPPQNLKAGSISDHDPPRRRPFRTDAVGRDVATTSTHAGLGSKASVGSDPKSIPLLDFGGGRGRFDTAPAGSAVGAEITSHRQAEISFDLQRVFLVCWIERDIGLTLRTALIGNVYIAPTLTKYSTRVCVGAIMRMNSYLLHQVGSWDVFWAVTRPQVWRGCGKPKRINAKSQKNDNRSLYH